MKIPLTWHIRYIVLLYKKIAMKTEYQQKVYKFLRAMKPDTTINIADVCKPESIEKFTTAVGKFISLNPEGWKYHFSNDYTKIVRDNIPEGISFEKFFKCEKK